ncbi:MAG: hypothetical protein ABS34_03835 [Opitutaceae bacterium BACL24 MAG-120322-bin51]|jgi:hypothetical protein|nr:MAG: hypothetical protein ABS34_03835 [Opitutaceae bacterium BACL24 MAG-120322-bin51]
MTALTDWIQRNEQLLQLLGSLSLLLLALTLVALALMVITLPEDYFTRDHRAPASFMHPHPLPWRALSLLKNLLGILFILVGIALLVLPGQGALTILIGLTMTNFPGKYRLERRMMRQPAINKMLNRIRKLAGKPRLEVPLLKGTTTQ